MEEKKPSTKGREDNRSSAEQRWICVKDMCDV